MADAATAAARAARLDIWTGPVESASTVIISAPFSDPRQVPAQVGRDNTTVPQTGRSMRETKRAPSDGCQRQTSKVSSVRVNDPSPPVSRAENST